MRILTSLFAAGLLAAAAQSQGLPDPIPEPIEEAAPQVRLETITDGMVAPNWGTTAPGQPGRLFVTDQPGTLWAVDLETGQKSVFLDVSSRLVSLGIAGPGSFDERGLLGVAFHPAYESNGLLYTYTSEPVGPPPDFSTMPPMTTANHQSVVLEWQVPNPTDPSSVVDPTSAREILRIDQPQFNHDAGNLVFGPDDLLYMSLGDGGMADDQGVGHVMGGNGQDPSNILGTILRIDPLGMNSSNGQYGIPSDNPFVGMSGFLDEIFAFGFRNPFRFSFDPVTGALVAADVGQNDIEEIDVVVAGGNYGWPHKEGSFFFDDNGMGAGFVTNTDPGVPAGLIDPIAEYDHDEGTAVIGGFVYRGKAVPYLRGRYVFGDLEGPSGDGRLFSLGLNGVITEFVVQGQAFAGFKLLGFGRDAQGELYVLANQTGTPFSTTGEVFRIAPAFPATAPGPQGPPSGRPLGPPFPPPSGKGGG